MTRDQEQRTLAMWCAGGDTLDIATHLGLPESTVANALPRLREWLSIRPSPTADRRAMIHLVHSKMRGDTVVTI
jgi:hypothetical protein